MKYTFIEQWSPSAWPFSCFPLPSPSYAFYFWSIMLALHVYSHTNVKIFLYFKSKTTCNGKSWHWLPDSNRLSYHRENCCKLFTCRFADKSLRFSRRKTPGGQRCKVFHIPWNSIQVCQREKLGEKCPFFCYGFCWQQCSDSHPRGLAMGILIPGSVHSIHIVLGAWHWLQLKSCCQSEVWRQQREKKAATLYNSSL